MKRCFRRFSAWLLLCVLLSATNAFAAGSIDENFVDPDSPYIWNNVKSYTFSGTDVSGTYKLFSDAGSGCVYIAVFLNETAVTDSASSADVRFMLKIESPYFTDKRLTFANGADQSEKAVDGLQTRCSIDFHRLSNAGTSVISGSAYIAVQFQHAEERCLNRLTLNYSCGDSAENIFKKRIADLTPVYEESQATASPADTSAAGNGSSQSKQAASGTTARSAAERSTKYTGKAALPSASSAVPSGADQSRARQNQQATKYTPGAGEQFAENVSSEDAYNAAHADEVLTAGPAHLSGTSVALLCLASVLAAAGVAAVLLGVWLRRKRKKKDLHREEESGQHQS